MYSQENKFWNSCSHYQDLHVHVYMYAWILQQFMGGGDDWV